MEGIYLNDSSKFTNGSLRPEVNKVENNIVKPAPEIKLNVYGIPIHLQKSLGKDTVRLSQDINKIKPVADDGGKGESDNLKRAKQELEERINKIIKNLERKWGNTKSALAEIFKN